jgi:Zn-dependent protease with chaperone function
MLVFGIWLLLNGPGFIGLIGGALLIGIAIVLRPRPGRMPPALRREEAPGLFGVPDAIAASLGVRPADRIAITGEFGAAVEEVGLRRQRVLYLGLPLMATLTPMERVAVLGHEFGHFANGDPLRGTIPSLAIDTLIEWYRLLRPEGIASSPDGDAFHGLLLIPVNLVLMVLSQVPIGLAYLIYLLSIQDGQRAEYYADLLAARLAGRDAVVAGWTKFHLGATVAAWTRATTDEHWLNRSLWDEIVARVKGFPNRELERAKRVAMVERSRIDATHPPTDSRIRLVDELGSAVGSVDIPEHTLADFESALRSASPAVQRAVIDRYTSVLYAG